MPLKQYRQKANQTVSALQLSIPECSLHYTKWGDTQSAKEDDWLVKQNDETYTVDQHSFLQTYRHISGNQYRKITPVWAEPASKSGSIKTKEGKTLFQPGDMLVYNHQNKTDGYAMPADKFYSLYEEINGEQPVTEDTSMLAEDYLNQRVNHQIAWYEKKAATNQASYKRYQLLAIIFGATIPLLTAISFEELEMLLRFTIALLGALIAIMNAVLSLYKFQENWVQYRGTAEALNREKLLFLTQTMPYENDEKENFKQFVERCESIMASENISWSKQVKPDTKTKTEKA